MEKGEKAKSGRGEKKGKRFTQSQLAMYRNVSYAFMHVQSV